MRNRYADRIAVVMAVLLAVAALLFATAARGAEPAPAPPAAGHHQAPRA